MFLHVLCVTRLCEYSLWVDWNWGPSILKRRKQHANRVFACEESTRTATIIMTRMMRRMLLNVVLITSPEPRLGFRVW